MDRSFGKDFEQKLRTLWHKVSPPDPVRRYLRRLNRELSQVSQAFTGTDKVILTHTYGKVGSTAIHKAINKQPGYLSFQTHVISEEGVAESRRSYPEDPEQIHLLVGEALRHALENNRDRQVRVITLVRDPVARAVSDLFENPVRIVGTEDIQEVSLEKLVAIATEQVLASVDYTERWFDREVRGLLNIDLFARDFDRVKGFQIFREGRFELLAGKLEQLSENGAGYLGRFLDLGRDFPIPNTRARSTTPEAFLYQQVRKNLKLPAGILDEVYSSRVCRHFYTAEELEKLRKLWIQS